MSLGAALGLAVLVVVTMFVLVFVMAGVETRMFNDVMVTPDAETDEALLAYPSDFFDLVIVDECHRGSARENSLWRGVLDHFSSAVQVGMTATPSEADDAETYRYFGNPVFTYTLRQGIEDGYLAPYDVLRVLPSPDEEGWEPLRGEVDMHGNAIPEGVYSTRDFERRISLLARTRVVAEHLTRLLARHPGERALSLIHI